MIAKTILRDIREERKKNFVSAMPHFDEEKHNQLLLLELPFKIDIVNLMNMWTEKRVSKESRKQTSILQILEDWAKSANDKENERNRRNAIQMLINKGIVFVCYDGAELKLSEFLQANPLVAVKRQISAIRYLKIATKKTYQVHFNSFLKFIEKFLYGHSSRRGKKFKPLKRGIRALELSEVASIFNQLELQALKSNSDISLKYLLIFRLILYAGESVEIKDILKLERKNIDFDNNIIRIKKKSVECSATFMKLLKSYLGSRRQIIFREVDSEQNLINKRLNSVCKKCDVSLEVFPQCIQRSFIYILKKEGVIN